jgi:3D (Asp-Asp-Asp) domain-containing protein
MPVRIGRIAGSLFPVVVFCGYLLLTSLENATPVAGQGGAPVLLSQAVRGDAPVPPPQPQTPAASAPTPDPKPNAEPAALIAADILAPEPTPVKAPGEKTADATPAPDPDRPAAAPKEKCREVWAVVTAYCPCTRCCGRFADGKTSVGVSAWKPGLAAEPKAVPYGTRVYVEGYGYAVVDDTGAAMRRVWRRKGQIQLDVRMTYHWQARQWGRKEMYIRVYDEPETATP